MRLLSWAYLAFLFIYSAPVIFVHQGKIFPFILRGSPNRETFQVMRTVFASVSLFAFFPIIRLLSGRNNAKQFILFSIAQVPAILGLILFVLSGAFKSFFIFLFLSLVYQLIVWPRGDEGQISRK